MDVLGGILVVFIMFLVVIMFSIPAIAMVAGLRWAAGRLPFKTNRWVTCGSVLMFMLIIPQIFNAFINRDVKNILAANQPRTSGDIPVDILAVQPADSPRTKRAMCGKDCALLLLSGEVEQYLVVEPATKTDVKKVTAFKFEDRSDCDQIDFLGRDMRSNLENTIRGMSLSGQCLTATESTLDIADVFVEHTAIEPDDRSLSRIKGLQTSIFQRHAPNGEWKEIQRDIGVRYRKVFPLFIPTFTTSTKRGPIGILTTIRYRDGRSEINCIADWFSEHTPCSRQLKPKPASALLGISVSAYSLEKNGVIDTKLNRTLSLSKLVKGIIAENRNPRPNEWTLIRDFISTEYHESETFSGVVIDVISHDAFPVPSIQHSMNVLSKDEKAVILDATIQRIGRDTPGPIIGDASEKRQWQRLYSIVKNSPDDLVEPYFNDLLKAVPKRPYKTQYIDFLRRFGAKSQQPILDLLKSDTKRLKSLSGVMCRMGSDLKGIEGPVMQMANNHQISLRGNYGNLVFLLLELGVTEEELLATVNPNRFGAARDLKSIQHFINRNNLKRKRCR